MGGRNGRLSGRLWLSKGARGAQMLSLRLSEGAHGAHIVSVIAITSAFCLLSSALVSAGSAAITSSSSMPATPTHAQHNAAATSACPQRRPGIRTRLRSREG
eukprot:scaffold56229_cov59-Phaeocystis_antarctica.AAC.1